jgi:predicted cupin superfamily sugar epimerase
MIPGLTAEAVVALLGLEPHPEGGFFRETFRDAPGPDGRAASTAIYYLLARGQRSHWHRVTDASEVWHWHAGAPLALDIAPLAGGPAGRTVLGSDLQAGQRPQGVVAPGDWQSAQSLGDWTLVGCTVAPGFEFSSFVMAPEGWSPV